MSKIFQNYRKVLSLWIASRKLKRRFRRAQVDFGRNCVFLPPIRVHQGLLQIGNGCYIQESELDARGGLRIGNSVQISGARILSASHDFDSAAFDTTFGRVRIDDYAVILPGAILLPGTHVGTGTVVGAGSVVFGSVPPMMVVSGNPFRVLRPRKAVQTGYAVSVLAAESFMELAQNGLRLKRPRDKSSPTDD